MASKLSPHEKKAELIFDNSSIVKNVARGSSSPIIDIPWLGEIHH
jgi:hypothetical protein